MKTRSVQIVLLVATLSLLAFGVRTWHLEEKGLWYDESLSLLRARLDLPGILSNQIALPGATTTDLHPPLYFLLLAGVTRLTGESDFSMRFLSVFWGVLLVPLLYATGARFWNRRTGLIAALLGAASPFYLWYAQEARMYTMVAALSLLAVYAFQRAIEERRTVWLTAAALATVAAAYTHYLALLILPVLVVQALLELRMRPRWRVLALVVIGGVALLSMPVAGYALRRLTSGYEVERVYLPLTTLMRDGLHAFHAGLTLDAGLWPLDLVFLAAFVFGALWPKPRNRWLFPWVYVFLPLIGMYSAALIKPIYAGSRYLIFISPGFYLGVARGLERTSRSKWPLALLGGLTGAVILGTMGVSSYRYFTAPEFRIKEDYRAAARSILASERPGDAIVVDGPENLTGFQHYYHGTSPVVGLPTVALSPQPDAAATGQALAGIAAQYARIWLVKVQTDISDPQNTVEAWLKQNTTEIEHAVYPSMGYAVEVQTYLAASPRLSALPDRQQKLEADLGPLRLEGYDLPLQPVSGGGLAWVTLYWRVLQPEANVKVSLRLLDAQGRQWGQTDQIPYPDYPPQAWPEGAWVRHEMAFRVPMGVAAGWYRLELRVYDAATGRPIEPGGMDAGPLPLGPLRVGATWADAATLRSLPTSLPANAVNLGSGAHFGEPLLLRAYVLGNQTYHAGEWVNVSLYWQVDTPPARGLTLDLQLLDARNRVMAEDKVAPVSSLYPIGLWQPGQLLWAQHSLLIPANAGAGVYHLRVGLQDDKGQVLPIKDRLRFWTWGAEALDLASFRVEDVARNYNRPDIAHMVEAQSTVGVDLLGFDALPAQVTPGDALDVRVFWRASVAPAASYKVSLQLLAADGRTLLAQEDSVPANWTRPTKGWALGEIISDPHRLTVPATVTPQRATLIVALYDEDTGARVQWLDGGKLQDHLVLWPLEIN